ncbi:hypothetical protein BC829DRAFT_449257 [Chytridium lagenaria]|nr:hypothetical protein BC829DRAFT_449257 [Chytridium lagenaria]
MPATTPTSSKTWCSRSTAVRRYCRSIRAACCPTTPQYPSSQPQPQPAPSIPEEYTEFSLYSSGPGMPAHIMRINAPRFSFSNLVPPLKMVRKIPEAPPPAVVDDDLSLQPLQRRKQLVQEEAEANKDPDRFPWALTDFKEEELEGNLEGSQRANYVLFIVRAEEDALSDKEVKPRDGFRVKPVSKWYKFNSRPKYATLTAEEAEARMTSRKKSNEQRWFMRNMKELDFDEVMSDDENPDFGIENEEEAKEAKKREFGDMARKAKFEEDEVFDDEDAKKKAKAAGSKSLTRVLKKNERESVYISDDEDKNPYDSEADDSDEEEQPNEIVEVIGKEDIAGAAATAAVSSISTGVVNSGAPGSSKQDRRLFQKGKKQKPSTSQSSPGLSSSSTSPKLGNGKSAGSSASPSPSVWWRFVATYWWRRMRKRGSQTDAPAPEPKRFKIKMGNSPEIAPPPPSAADIIADDRNRRIAVRKSGGHPSIASSSTSPAVRSSGTPSVISVTPALGTLSSESAESSTERGQSKKIVARLREKISRHPDNKDRIREILKRRLPD